MGHRKSHSRDQMQIIGAQAPSFPNQERCSKVSKKEKAEVHDEDKDHRRERKRKREHKEEASRKKHKERERGSKSSHHHRSKSSAKRKTKDRVTRLKPHESSETSSSESYGSTSSESFKRHGHRHHRRRHKVEHATKRSTKDDEMARMSDKRRSYDGQSELRHPSEEPLRSEVQESHMSRLKNGTLTQPQEQEMGINGKESLLEVELRQRALANFIRHRDTSSQVQESNEGLTSTSPLALKEISKKNGESPTTVDSKWASHLSDEGARIHEHQSALITDDKDLHSHHVEDRALAHACDDAVEEGEIGHHMVEPANVNTSSLLTKDYISVCKSGMLEQKGMPPQAELEAAPCEEDSALVTDVGPATAGQDSKTGFQKKTMSVMRGGEMVQVTYNVYIPKRAAELAKRRLHR